MVRTFTDDSGRSWHPHITCTTLVRYEEQTGVCLLSTGEDIFKGRIGHLLRLAYLACSREAQERRLTFEAFCEGFGSPETIRTAGEQIAEALADFFLKSPQGAPVTPERPGAGPTSTP